MPDVTHRWPKAYSKFKKSQYLCYTICMIIIHIIGAGILGLFVLTAITTLITKKARYYKFLAISIAVNTVVQIVSGVWLTIASNEGMSVIAFCTRIGAYLFLVLVMESSLILAIRNAERSAERNTKKSLSHLHATTKPETGQAYIPNV